MLHCTTNNKLSKFVFFSIVKQYVLCLRTPSLRMDEIQTTKLTSVSVWDRIMNSPQTAPNRTNLDSGFPSFRRRHPTLTNTPVSKRTRGDYHPTNQIALMPIIIPMRLVVRPIPLLPEVAVGPAVVVVALLPAPTSSGTTGQAMVQSAPPLSLSVMTVQSTKAFQSALQGSFCKLHRSVQSFCKLLQIMALVSLQRLGNVSVGMDVHKQDWQAFKFLVVLLPCNVQHCDTLNRRSEH